MEAKEKTTKDAGLAALLNESRELRKEVEDYIVAEGKIYHLSEWLTLSDYAKRHDISSPNVITNWIARGTVPADDVRLFPYLNNLRLIRNKQYKEDK